MSNSFHPSQFPIWDQRIYLSGSPNSRFWTQKKCLSLIVLVTFSFFKLTINFVCFFFSFLADVNECLGFTHGCHHFCENNIGSFTCSCRTGYTLDADGKQCHGRTIICPSALYLTVFDTKQRRTKDFPGVPLRKLGFFAIFWWKNARKSKNFDW